MPKPVDKAAIQRFLGEGTFFIRGEGGGPALRRGGSLINLLQIGECQTCFIRSRGRVTVFFGKEKNYFMSLS